MVVDLPVPAEVRWIVETLEDAGFETWAVGGAVRDGVRGVRSTDWDFATQARPRQVQRLFRRTVPLGLAHGTVGVIDRDGVMHEVTTFRKDVETDGRHAVVAFADRIEDDLARRDFTINALAWHPLRGELLDPFGGRSDLGAGILRTVGNPDHRFAEDYLRILRALRFAGRFGLTIEAETWRAMQQAAPKLTALSPERVREELLKVLGAPQAPSTALHAYRASGALGILYPELAALDEEDWQRTVAEVDRLPPERPWLRLAALLARIGTAPPRPDDPDLDGVTGLVARDDEARRCVVRAVALLSRLRAPNARMAEITGWLAQGVHPPHLVDGAARRRWLARAGPEHLSGLADLWRVRHEVNPDQVPDPSPTIRALMAERDAGVALAVGDLAVTGRDLIALGLRPGPRFGEILEALLGDVLDDPTLNDRAELLSRLRARVGEPPSPESGA